MATHVVKVLPLCTIWKRQLLTSSQLSASTLNWHRDLKKKFLDKRGQPKRKEPSFNQKPDNENEIHWKCKQHIMSEFFKHRNSSSRRPISIDAEVTCSYEGDFWKCDNTQIVKQFIKGWTSEDTEFHIRDIGRLDVALIYDNYRAESVATPQSARSSEMAMTIVNTLYPQLSSLAEEFHRVIVKFINGTTEEMSFSPHVSSLGRKVVHTLADAMNLIHETKETPEGKVLTIKKKPDYNRLVKIEGLAAIEVFSTAAMTDKKVEKMNEAKVPWIEIRASPSFYLRGPKQWSLHKPLKAVRSSYQNAGVGNWICEECQNSIQKHLNFEKIATIVDLYLMPNKLQISGTIRRHVFLILNHHHDYFLVEGSLASDLDIKRIANPHTLLGRVKADSLSNAEEALKPLAQMRLDELQKSAKLHSIVLPYPGRNAEQMFQGDEVLKTRNAIKPVMLYPSLSRLFGYKYQWSFKDGAWKPQSEMYPEFNKSV